MVKPYKSGRTILNHNADRHACERLGSYISVIESFELRVFHRRVHEV